MANLKTNNLSGEGGRNAISGSVYFSGYIDGDSADYLTIADTDDLDMGTGDFTFECWLRGAETSGGYAGIFGMYDYDNAGILIQISNTGVLRLVNPTQIAQTGSTVIIPQDGTMGDWHHIAVTRASGTIKGYVNGIEEISVSYSSAVDFCNGGFAVIGVTDRTDYPGDLDFKGYISNLRVCKGHAVYTGEFTPPTSPLTVHYNSENDKTSLLCCQDSDNPLQEATGKTIAGYGRHPSQTYDANGEGPELVTSTGVWTLSKGGSGSSNFTVSNSGRGLSGTTVPSGYIRATYSGFNRLSKYRIKLTYTAGSNNNLAVQGYDKDGGTVTNYFPATDGTAGTALQVGETYVFEASGVGQWQITGSAWSTEYTIDDISIKQIPNEVSTKVTPPYGVDAGNTFNGAIAMNSSSYMYFPTGGRDQRGRGRGFYMLGYNGTPSASASSRIDSINIQSHGNSIKFGDLTVNRYTLGAGSSSTRGLFTGGYQDGLSPDTDVNAIEFITIATEGNAIDFGDRTMVGRLPACASNDTRCVMASAFTPQGYQNRIDFVTIASIGNASDFGDLSTARASMAMSCNSTTRGIFNGGYQPAPSTIRVNNMEYITFATTGNTQDFGDLTAAPQSSSGGTLSSGTRGLIGLAYVHPAITNSIDFCTIATTGNALDFGDTTAAKQSYGSCTNSIRGLIMGGQTPSYINNIDTVIIATTGDATDFGDVDIGVTASGAAGSDSHGGLS